MRSNTELTLKDKINILESLFKRPDEIKSKTEGSKVIILTVDPKEETKALEELKKTFDSMTYIDISEILLKVIDEYGLENLKEDREFYGNNYKESFLRKFLNLIIEETINQSKYKIVVIHRIGILNGLLRINQIIESITGDLNNPVVMIYPGKRQEERLHFLNERHVTSVYRAEII
ncbi:MAG: BREX protein BrxB domain-containing protein [Athalassotoga sp.]|uniref:BREX protein BrxB domain-containing protein n=1 Tax=Athalassotoga sp. TaxID=2022597 RepID=UPI003CFD9652